MKKIISTVAVVAGLGFAQTTTQPAAKVHVKQVNGTYLKYTSKLKQVVELNFTMGFDHKDGKPVITSALSRIGAANGFTVKSYTGTGTGTTKNNIPVFTLDNLLAGEVIVTNNISGLGSATLGTANRDAIQKAIETEGRGYLGIHGSGDETGSNWAFYSNSLHPVEFKTHANRVPAPVYKHLAETDNIILEKVLATATTAADVPNEVSGGAEVIAKGVQTRAMKNEWYQFQRQIADDPKYAPLVTMLLKYDGRSLGNDLPAAYRRKGGNMFTWLIKIGKGVGSYMPPGHDKDEMTDAKTGMDGGAGDYDRYFGQLLWFLAGYTTEVCGASNCAALPIVDSLNRLTGKSYTGGGTGTLREGILKSDLFMDDSKVAFSSPYADKKYEAKVMDLSGHVLATTTGKGVIYYEFDRTKFKTGVFLMSVKVGNSQPKIKRYAFMPGSL